MLLPLSRIWSSFATTLLPSAVISLRTETPGRDGQNRNSRRAGRLGLERKEKNALDRSRSDARRRVEAAFGLTRVATHYSTTSSSTMLTYTSNPLSVPTISLSVRLLHRHHLHAAEEETLGLEALDDLADETALDAVGLDHDVGLLHSCCGW